MARPSWRWRAHSLFFQSERSRRIPLSDRSLMKPRSFSQCSIFPPAFLFERRTSRLFCKSSSSSSSSSSQYLCQRLDCRQTGSLGRACPGHTPRAVIKINWSKFICHLEIDDINCSHLRVKTSVWYLKMPDWCRWQFHVLLHITYFCFNSSHFYSNVLVLLLFLLKLLLL